MDADVDANVDEEGEGREGGDLGKDKELIRRGGDDTVDAEGRRCGGGQGARQGDSYLAATASDLAPTVAHFLLTKKIRRTRREKREMTAEARRTAAAEEQKGGEIKGEVLMGTFLSRRTATTTAMPTRGTSTILK